MQSGTASKLADSTALTADIADLNQIDGLTKQTTISDSDASFPTSGAVVDYVAAQIAPLGGLEVISNEVSFPNTQPASGVVISISDAGGVVFNGSGVSTTGRTVGGSTVTINGAPSSLNSETLAAGVGLMVSSTGSSQTYNYHKILGKEDDIKQLSDDINDFAERYRVGSSNPTSALDSGDMFFNTSTGKMLVYNGVNSAWEEVQSIGNFFISSFSESFDGSRTAFTVSNAPTNAQQLIISINGVIQKPNSGTGSPSEGFTLSGSTVTFSSAIPSGSDYFVIVLGSTVNIGTPSNNTVSSAILQNGSVTTPKLADQAVTLDKLPHGTSSNNGKFLRANNGADPTFESVITDLVNDTSPQLGGTLDVNGQIISFGDSSSLDDRLTFGAGTNGDLRIYHNGTDSFIENQAGYLYVDSGTSAIRLISDGSWANGKMAAFYRNGGVELYYDNSKKLETTNSGGTLYGDWLADANFLLADNDKIKLGNAADLQIYHDGVNGSYIDNVTGTADLYIRNTNGNSIYLNPRGSEVGVKVIPDGAVELYHNNVKKLETTTSGVNIEGVHDGVVNINTTDPRGSFIRFKYNGTTKAYVGCPEGFGAGTEEDIGLRSERHIYFMSGGSTKWSINTNGTLYPAANNSYDIGDSSTRVRNIYTNDLHLSNEGSSNDVDGTWGDWTIQEGETDLFLKNNRSGKKYKFNLTEVS